MEAATRRFGTLDLRDGEVFVADGGIHGVQGHRLLIRADGTASWERRVDSFDPVGSEGAGEMRLDGVEFAALYTWADAAWQLAERERGSDLKLSLEREIPRWVWVVAVRRGNETRVTEGGGVSHAMAPAELAELLAWLRERVDTLASGRGSRFRDWVRRRLGR